MKKHILTLAPAVVLLLGLSLLLYPTVSDRWNSYHQSRAIEAYTQAVETMDEAYYDALWTQAQNYNDQLSRRTNRFLLTKEQKEAYDRLLNTGDNGIMGYVEIPKIDVLLPVYHGTDEGVLQVAAGHLDWTGLPVGGEGNHCVISGHRGLPSARLFTDLDLMEKGDLFVLHVLGRELTYRVSQIFVVKPHETDELMPREGEDLCTLVTCTPYGINSHRLLVRGTRTESREAQPLLYLTADAVTLSPALAASAAMVPLLAAMIVYLLLPGKKRGGNNYEAT